MDDTNYNFKLGLIFATTTVFFWGMLPIALKLAAGFIDPVTLTWFRFLVAFLVSVVLQKLSGYLVQFKQLVPLDWAKLTAAACFSMINYFSFVYCLEYFSPGPAQLNFQTAPFFLAFGGMLFFKERISALQMSCFATLALGMMLFFQPSFGHSSGEQQVWVGVILVQFSALSWACYALLQKSLFTKLSPGNVLLYIYGAGIVIMLPMSDFDYFVHMSVSQWSVAFFCALNTLVAYGCFAQAMKYWSTAQVGATVALTPIFSFSFTAIIVAIGWWPDIIVPNNINVIGVVGILLVVCSVLCVQLLPLINKHKKERILTKVSP